MPVPAIPPIGPDLGQWGRQLSLYLQRNLAKLGFKSADDNPSDDGIVLFDREKKFPVVSVSNSFRQLATQQPAPSSSTGSAGDVTGMISWDSNYIYVCSADYDGTTSIWKRVQLTTW